MRRREGKMKEGRKRGKRGGRERHQKLLMGQEFLALFHVKG